MRPLASGPMEARRTDLLRASPRMFDNELLDKLSRVHPAVPVILFVPAIGVLLGLAVGRVSALGFVGLVAGGYAFWTLSEYWIHRIIFHFEPEEGFGARLHWIIHGVHHDHPNDPLRLVMPPSVSVPLSSLFVLGFYAVLGSPLFLPFAGGFLAG
ncbi:MAG: dihydroceramide fatty acyl 2-hydroxylase [Thermoleophilaceae bacterium]|nr:dihydroceramide fatty acyl 2-hydroxylase [Thermoleophilaceae bacterium]